MSLCWLWLCRHHSEKGNSTSDRSKQQHSDSDKTALDGTMTHLNAKSLRVNCVVSLLWCVDGDLESDAADGDDVSVSSSPHTPSSPPPSTPPSAPSTPQQGLLRHFSFSGSNKQNSPGHTAGGCLPMCLSLYVWVWCKMLLETCCSWHSTLITRREEGWK